MGLCMLNFLLYAMHASLPSLHTAIRTPHLEFGRMLLGIVSHTPLYVFEMF